MPGIPFNPDDTGRMEIVRIIVLERLRAGNGWNQIRGYQETGFDSYVEYCQ
jgi:hypothetical protein